VILHQRPHDSDDVWSGPQGLIAAIVRVAIEDACGRNVHLQNPYLASTISDQQSARRFLRSRELDLLVARCGADPAVIREALERRLPWMRGDSNV
jgi:hypothetical protein